MKAIILVGALLATASAAQAQDQKSVPTGPVTTAAQSGERPVTPGRITPTPIDTAELSTLNGRQGNTNTVLSDQDLTAVSNGNTVTANRIDSGDISINGGAFQGFSGVGNFVMNSGQNNNLQGAITINVMSPTP